MMKVYTAERMEIEMKRTISSSVTIVYKFIFPGFMILAFAGGGFVMLAGGETRIALPYSFFFVLVIVLAYYFGMRLKKVEMDDEKLYISNYSRVIEVHRSKIKKVSENKWINIHPVYIDFSTSTEFGDRIVFMPKVRPFAFFSSHPIVGELKSWIERR